MHSSYPCMLNFLKAEALAQAVCFQIEYLAFNLIPIPDCTDRLIKAEKMKQSGQLATGSYLKFFILEILCSNQLEVVAWYTYVWRRGLFHLEFSVTMIFYMDILQHMRFLMSLSKWGQPCMLLLLSFYSLAKNKQKCPSEAI